MEGGQNNGLIRNVNTPSTLSIFSFQCNTTISKSMNFMISSTAMKTIENH